MVPDDVGAQVLEVSGRYQRFSAPADDVPGPGRPCCSVGHDNETEAWRCNGSKAGVAEPDPSDPTYQAGRASRNEEVEALMAEIGDLRRKLASAVGVLVSLDIDPAIIDRFDVESAHEGAD